MKNIIEVNNVSFEYITDENTLKAIDNLDLQVKEGEFVAIIGTFIAIPSRATTPKGSWKIYAI